MLRYAKGDGLKHRKVVLLTKIGSWTLEQAPETLEMLLEESFDASAR